MVVGGWWCGGGRYYKDEREVLLPRRGCDACPLVGGLAELARDAQYPVRSRCLMDGEHGFHTQHTQEGVPHQPEPEPEALLRRGPLVGGRRSTASSA